MAEPEDKPIIITANEVAAVTNPTTQVTPGQLATSSSAKIALPQSSSVTVITPEKLPPIRTALYRTNIIAHVDDTVEIMQEKETLNQLAFKLRAYNGQPAVWVFPDSDGDGKLRRAEIRALLNNHRLNGYWPVGKKEEYEAMLDPANESALITNKPRHDIEPSVKTTFVPKIYDGPFSGEFPARANSRKEFWDRTEYEVKADPKAGKRYRSLDTNNNYQITVRELKQHYLAPEMQGHWLDAAKSGIAFRLTSASGKLPLYIGSGYMNYKSGNRPWPSDVTEVVQPILDKPNLTNADVDTIIGFLNDRDKQITANLPSVIKDKIETNRKFQDGFMGNSILSLKKDFDRLLKSTQPANAQPVTHELKDEVVKHLTACDQIRAVIYVRENQAEMVRGIVSSTALDNEVKGSIDILESMKSGTRDYIKPDKEIEPMFPVPEGETFEPRILENFPVITAEKNETVEHEMARLRFAELTTWVVAGKFYSLDTNNDGALSNVEAWQNLTNTEISRGLTPEQRYQLREMVNMGQEVVTSIPTLEEFMKQPLITAGISEKTKEFIKVRDVPNNEGIADGQLTAGEALKALQPKAAAAKTAKLQ